MQKKKTKIFFRFLLILLLLLTVIGIAGCGSSNGAGEHNVGVAIGDNKSFHAWEPSGNDDITDDLEDEDEYDEPDFVGFGFYTKIGSTHHRQEKIAEQTCPFRLLDETMYHSLFGDDLWNDSGWTVELYGPTSRTGNYGIDLNPFTVCQNVATESAAIMNRDGEQIFQDVLGILKSVVAGILVIFWAMQFMQQIIQERFTMESFLKGMCQLVIGLLIVNNAQNIAGAFVNGANEAIANFSTTETTSQAVKDFQQFCWTKSNDNVFYICFFAGGFNDAWFVSPIFWVDVGSLVGLVIMILPFIGQFLCAYQIVTQMVTRMIELIVRVAVSPIPLAFGAAQGFGPSSISFIKGTFATAMQPILIMIGARTFGSIVDLIVAALAGSGTSGGINMQSLLGSLILFIAYMVLSGFIGQTRQLSQEILAR